MKHIYRGVMFAFMATIIISSVVCFQLIQAKEENIKPLQKKDIATVQVFQTVQIELKKSVTLDTLFPKGTNSSFDRVILESEFTFDDEDIYDFYVVNPKSEEKNIEKDYIKNRKAFLADTKNVAEMSSANSKNVENILITKFTVMGEKNKINEMKKGLEISKINVKPDQSSIVPQIPEKSIPKEIHLLNDKMINSKISSPDAKDGSLDELVPNSGTSYLHPSSHGGRYVKQYMQWDSIDFSEEQTYEHDFWFYNYDRKTYLDNNTTAFPGCWPEFTYASTSWPAESKPYLDTRFGYNQYGVPICEIDELAYTIGAAKASELQAHTNYYTYIRTEYGNDSTDKFKLQAQIGHRSPSYCYTTWCSFGDQSYNLVPSWAYVPSTVNWTYDKAPAAPSNVSISNPTNTSLRMNFIDNATNETSTAVERKISGGSWNLLGAFGELSGIGNYYWTNTGLSSGTTYCYRLKAFNAFGSSAYSNESCGLTL